MQTTIKYVNPPKPGKRLGTIKDQNNNLHFFDPSKIQLSQGVYDLQLENREWNGKTYSHVIGATAAGTQGNGGESTSDRWYMPFVSNTVAHALAAGKIEEPMQIKAWAAAAKQAAVELDETDQSGEPNF